MLSPFLFIYALVVIWGYTPNLDSDEGRYLNFAQNLLNGYYSNPYPDINLWNGPGYPLIIAFFLMLGANNFFIVFVNVFFHFGSVVFLYLSSRFIVGRKISLVVTLIWAAWFFTYKQMAEIMTESFVFFLMGLLIYLILSNTKWQTRKTLLTGLTIGYLILTKVIFFYVFLFVLVLGILYSVLYKKTFGSTLFRLTFSVFLVITPYLGYTYNLTGKLFYLSDAGGMSLYWMSSPYEGEFGDWNAVSLDSYCWDGNLQCNQEYFQKNHGEFMGKIKGLDPIARNEAFKSKAVDNIKNHPIAYLKNCYANFLRMFFNYPESYSFSRMSTILRIIPGAFLITFSLLAFFVLLKSLISLPCKIMLLFSIVCIYMAGSTVLSAYPRMLYVTLPAILLLIGYVFQHKIKTELL